MPCLCKSFIISNKFSHKKEKQYKKKHTTIKKMKVHIARNIMIKWQGSRLYTVNAQ